MLSADRRGYGLRLRYDELLTIGHPIQESLCTAHKHGSTTSVQDDHTQVRLKNRLRSIEQ